MCLRICLLLALVAVVFSAATSGNDCARYGQIVLRKRLIYGKQTLQSVISHVQGCLKKESSVTLEDVQDTFYYGAIQIGTPDQEFLVEFNTALTDLWVPSKQFCLDTPSYCRTHHAYDGLRSETYKVKDLQEFEITYGKERDVVGFLSQDNVKVAGVTVRNQIFGEVKVMDRLTLKSITDGVLGLAYKSCSFYGANPVLLNMIEQETVEEPVFSFYLNPTEPADNGGAEFTLGGVDEKYYTGEFTWTDVTKPEYWQIEIDGIKLNEDVICENHAAIPDVSSSLIYIPKSLCAQIHADIPAGTFTNGVFIVDCSKVDSFPDIAFTIGGKDFLLTGKDYVKKLADEITGIEQCISCLVGLDSSYVILGDPFMRKYYTQFDMGNNRVGFAPAK